MNTKKDDPNRKTENDQPDDRLAAFHARTGGHSEVKIRLDPGASLEVTVTQVNREGTPVSMERKCFTHELEASQRESTAARVNEGAQARFFSKINSQTWFFLAALVIYLITRFIGLDSYPIYFFTDEAVQTVLAADLVQNDFRDYQDEILPTYFQNGGQYNLGTSVYLQIVPWLIFGKSIWATRGTSVLISLLAAISTGLMLKNIFKTGYAFAGILILSETPAWFLHSRTAFETVTAVAFYAGFLYAYLRYRTGTPKALPLAVIFGALCFYSYSPAQMVVAVTALLFVIVDLRTHLRNRKIVLLSLGAAALLAIPYIRFLVLHPDENRRHLEILNSYLISDMAFIEKLGIYFSEYFKMLHPLYWFAPNPVDLERHLMKGYGHLPVWSAPLFFLGLWLVLKNLRQPENRVLIIALLAAPAGAALAGAAVTRSLFLVVPAALVSTIGLEEVLDHLKKRKIPSLVLRVLVFAILSAVNFFMLRDALVNGPLWYSNYSLTGQQYGARQVFAEINDLLAKDPERKVFLSPSWTNGTDVVARFFIENTTSFEMGSIDNYLFQKLEFDPRQVFILIPEEMEKAISSRKFKTIETIKTIDYPSGEPGFYLLHLEYADNVDELLAEEEATRRKLYHVELVDAQHHRFSVEYPALDMGAIENLFDGDADSFVRTMASNPMVLRIEPLEPLILHQILVSIGGTGSTVSVTVNPADGSGEIVFNMTLEESNDFRDVVFPMEYPVEADWIEVIVENTHDPEIAHVHVWELNLQ